MKIIHISDTHFTGSSSDDEKISIIKVALEYYIANRWGRNHPKIIVITGDLTDSGDDEDYNSAKNFIIMLQNFGFIVYAVPGNHDYCKKGWLNTIPAFGCRRLKFIHRICSLTSQSGKYPQVIDLSNLTKLILLDSMQAEIDEDTGDSFAQGKLGEKQLSDLKARLAELEKERKDGTKIVVALHHHPFKPEAADDHGLSGTNRGGLNDAQQFLEIIANKIDCLLFGHSTPDENICQKSFMKSDLVTQPPESVMYGIPLINVENLENMNYYTGKISVIDLADNYIEVYPTDVAQISPIEHGIVPSDTEIYITPAVTRVGAVIYNYSDVAPSIKFQSGDRVTMTIGGAVQTGGKRKTWKRYVNPSGRNSDSLYFGQIYIPGITGLGPANGLNPIRDLVNIYGSYDSENSDKCTLRFTIPKIDTIPEYNRYLALGYMDNDYSNNGYWGHDNGTEDQCKNVGPAYVKISIQHMTKILSVRQYMKQIGAEPSAGIRHLLPEGVTSVRDLLSYY